MRPYQSSELCDKPKDNHFSVTRLTLPSHRLSTQDAGNKLTTCAKGSLSKGPVSDRLFTGIQPPAGPFATVTAFHDWLTGLQGGGWDELRDPGMLSDDYTAQLAHGDLHRSNIVIRQGDSSGRWTLSGIVDWEMCSWVPEYWDYCRARWPLTPEENAAFGEVYLPCVFGEPSGEYAELYKYWHFFVDRLGSLPI